MSNTVISDTLIKEAFLGGSFFKNLTSNVANAGNRVLSDAAAVGGKAGAESVTGGVTNLAKAGVNVMAALTLGGVALSVLLNKINNDTRRSGLLKDLMDHDPIIKQADPDEVKSYYATIYNVAPTVSVDKNAVKELLQAFVKFGRVDINTLKLLSEVENNLSKRGLQPAAFLTTGKLQG